MKKRILFLFSLLTVSATSVFCMKHNNLYNSTQKTLLKEALANFNYYKDGNTIENITNTYENNIKGTFRVYPTDYYPANDTFLSLKVRPIICFIKNEKNCPEEVDYYKIKIIVKAKSIETYIKVVVEKEQKDIIEKIASLLDIDCTKIKSIDCLHTELCNKLDKFELICSYQTNYDQ